MPKLAMAVGLMYVLLGTTLAVSPERFLSVPDWESRQGLHASAGIRVLAELSGRAQPYREIAETGRLRHERLRVWWRK